MLRFDQLNQLAEPHVQRLCDSPKGIDVGILAARLNHSQMAARHSGESGKHLLRHAALRPEATDDLTGDSAVVFHMHSSFLKDDCLHKGACILREAGF